MKTHKYLKALIIPAVFAALVTGFSLTPAAGSCSDTQAEETSAPVENIEGTSEFYYRPAGETRLWHVTNTYTSRLPEDSSGINNSTYVFTSDSVTVVNNYTGVKEIKIIQ